MNLFVPPELSDKVPAVNVGVVFRSSLTKVVKPQLPTVDKFRPKSFNPVDISFSGFEMLAVNT